MASTRLVSFKWRWLAMWWAGQAVVLYYLWALLLAEDLDDIRRVLTEAPDRDWALSVGLGIAMVSLLQAAALLPLRRARMGKATWWGLLGRHAASGIAIGVMVSLVAWLPLRWLAEQSGELWGSYLQDEILYWAPAPVVGTIATIVLWRRYGTRTPLWLSALTGAFLVGLLCAALAFAIVGVIDEYSSVDVEPMVPWIVLCVLPGWVVGTPLILAFLKRGAKESQLQRMSARLLLGTVVELAAVIPLDVMVRRKTDCYCGTGTYWALTIMGGVALCALGPFVLLAPAGRRRRRLREGRCEACGYDMRGAAADRCPECGAGWRGGKSA
ncbi:MAG: hypothetical protein ACF8R7_14735 [Phycisphaerales bacterium JB039]